MEAWEIHYVWTSLLYLQSYFPRRVWQANNLERLGQIDFLRKARISGKQIKTKLLSQSKKSYPADGEEIWNRSKLSKIFNI